jgi:hypothetical protein
MISRIQHLPVVKQESFLRTKYESEELSVKQIAAVLNTMGIRTRSCRAPWYAKTVNPRV